MKPTRIGPITIYAGQTFATQFERSFFPYPVTERGGVLYRDDGSKANEGDRVMEDYTGCTAIMEVRDGGAGGDLLATLSTENGGIVLDGAVLSLLIAAEDTKADALQPFQEAWGHVEVRRADNTIERQYEIEFAYSAEVTEADPEEL